MGDPVRIDKSRSKMWVISDNHANTIGKHRRKYDAFNDVHSRGNFTILRRHGPGGRPYYAVERRS